MMGLTSQDLPSSTDYLLGPGKGRLIHFVQFYSCFGRRCRLVQVTLSWIEIEVARLVFKE